MVDLIRANQLISSLEKVEQGFKNGFFPYDQSVTIEIFSPQNSNKV